MAAGSKEKKRKALAEAPTADAPQKKHKKAKGIKGTVDAANSAKSIATPTASKAQPEAPKVPATDAGFSKPQPTVRKRAIDFLSDDEDDSVGGAKLPDEAAEKSTQKHDRSSKKSKNQKKAEKSRGLPSTSTDKVQHAEKVEALERTGKNMKKTVRFTEDSREDGQAVIADMTVQSTPKKKKRGPTVSDVMADRFNKLITTEPSQWNSDRKKNQQKNASNATYAGKEVHNPNGDVQEALIAAEVKDSASTALQTEAQGFGGEDKGPSEDQHEDLAPELLAGFDSDSPDDNEDEGFDSKAQSFTLPKYKKTNKLLRKAAEKGNSDGVGTVYIGRIPHGFYEHQMRAYFSQFGTVTKLRLSRNRQTGASKHFAFVQFESAEVAKIVAKTMDNYLMFGHILKCKFAPEETLHPDVWKGANRRYRKIPHNKIEGKWLDSPKTKEYWAAKIEREQQKREAKAEKLKELGYQIEVPKMTGVDDIFEEKAENLLESAAPAKTPKADEAITPATAAAQSGVSSGQVPFPSKEANKNKAKHGEENGILPSPLPEPSVTPNFGKATAQAAADVVNDLPTSQRKKEKKREGKREERKIHEPKKTNSDAAGVAADADMEGSSEGFGAASKNKDAPKPTSGSVARQDGLTKHQRKRRRRQERKAAEKAAEKAAGALGAANTEANAITKTNGQAAKSKI